MVGAGGQIHIPMPRLGKPAGAQHLSAADGAGILAPGHGSQSLPLIRIVPKDLPIQAARQLRAVEAVFMAAHRLVVFVDAPGQIQPLTDQGCMVGVPQGIMGRTAGLDLENFHGGFQGLLGIGAIGLGVENHLDIVPLLRPAPIQGKQLQILPQDADVVKAPGEEHRLLAAPAAELLHGLREGHSLGTESCLLDAREFTDPAVQMPVEFRHHHHLEFIRRAAQRIQAHGSDLNDLSPDGHREHFFRRRGTGPGLVPLHIQNNKVHCLNLCLLSFPCIIPY